jgi:trans-aconitate methyltransferase
MNRDEYDRLLQEQIAYYRARAGEYDEWFLRLGRYDRGPELNARWFAEVGQVRAALDRFRPAGRVMELACGTGLWTQVLAGYPTSLTAIDASAEVLALNRARLPLGRVCYQQADLFQWQPDSTYDMVFFSFWLSHVPPTHFDTFWQTVRSSLAPGGRAFFVDSRYEPTSSATDHTLRAREEFVTTRRLNSGDEFQIVKIFYEPHALTERLAGLGWEFEIAETAHYFIYGQGAVNR